MPLGEADSSDFARIRAAGATKVRLAVSWRSVAPTKPRVNPADPEDPAYNWNAVDDQVRRATAEGLDPILLLYFTPRWAAARSGTPGTQAPEPAALGAFATAAATRYSGRFNGLPRVRNWQVWNEPNLGLFFQPQFENGEPFSPGWYRRMVNEVAAGVKGVSPDNVVVAGGTAPVHDTSVDMVGTERVWGPLVFMQEFLCLDAALEKKCDVPVSFDVWAHHPYTNGGPTHKAGVAGDAALGDLPQMRRILRAGYRAGNVIGGGRPAFWVTEFSWDSNPPDPGGVPTRLHTRWVAEAMYRMWKSGVTLVTWFSLHDLPLASSPFQSGLYYWSPTSGDMRPKPVLRAFRFPLVAFPLRKGLLVWGRTPGARPANVLVEQSFRGGWRQLAVIPTNRYGIFQRRIAGARTGLVRARTTDIGEWAGPFPLAPVRDQPFPPFGSS